MQTGGWGGEGGLCGVGIIGEKEPKSQIKQGCDPRFYAPKPARKLALAS